MKKLKIEFPEEAKEELDKFMRNSPTVREFRGAQCVREVVNGQSMRKTARIYNFTYDV